MNDIEIILEKNKDNFFLKRDGLDNPVIDMDKAREYLTKYWLSEDDYLSKYKPIQDKIFINQEKGLPEMIFNKDYNLFISTGMVLFMEDDFKALTSSLSQIGETSIIIIQNFFDRKFDYPPIRMKYPADITWEELNSGDFISEVLFHVFYDEYFVFGDDTLWGKYAAIDYEYPFDIVGCRNEIVNHFIPNFYPLIDDLSELGKKMLPEVYRKLST